MVVERLINWEPLTQAYKSLNWKWRLLATSSVLAIVVEFLYFVCYAIPWAKMGVAEWAYWVGAVGTILAMCGAIWISNRDNAFRRRNAMTIAILVASTSQSKAQQLNESIDSVIKHLSNSDSGWLTESKFNDAKKALAQCKTFDIDTITQLAPLGGNCALMIAKIHNAISNVSYALNKLQVYEHPSGPSWKDNMKGMADTYFGGELNTLEHQKKQLGKVLDILRASGG